MQGSIVRLVLFTVSLLALPQVVADTLQPFESDGCSAFPDGTPAQNELWLGCCVAHDFAYWKGGSFEERKVADTALQVCVSEVGEKAIANIMLTGVRVGGTPLLPTTFRWGYGWSYPKFYGEMTREELVEVEKLIDGPDQQQRKLPHCLGDSVE